MKTLQFTVPGAPKGKARPRVTRMGHAYTPKDTVMYENLVRTCFMEKYPKHKPEHGSVYASIIAYFPIAKGTSKKKIIEMAHGDLQPLKKPDVDNIIKSILDSLNNIAYTDDSQVVGCAATKYYSDQPRVEVVLKFPGDNTGENENEKEY